MLVEITRLFRRRGEETDTLTSVPDELTGQYKLMRSAGLRLTVEVLRTNEVSLCIENKIYGDFITELASIQGHHSQQALERLLTRFNMDTYNKWLVYQITAEG